MRSFPARAAVPMIAIESCRTAALGGHVERCSACGHQRIAYDSCRNRNCPNPEDLEQRVRTILAEHADLRWDDAIQVVLDETQLSRVRVEKERAKKKSGDFTSDSDDDLDNADEGGQP